MTDNNAIGIFMEISRGSLIAGNVVAHNGAGIQISNSADARLYNNTLVGNGSNLNLFGWHRDPSGWDEGLPVNYVTQHLTIKNNILADATTTRWPLTQLDAAQDKGDKMPMVDALDHNAYMRSAAAQPQHTIRWMPFDKEGNEEQFRTLADFQARVGLEAHGRALDNVPLTDVFVNPGAGDYRLKGGSSLKGVGEALPQDVADALGVPGGQTVDVGALHP